METFWAIEIAVQLGLYTYLLTHGFLLGWRRRYPTLYLYIALMLPTASLAILLFDFVGDTTAYLLAFAAAGTGSVLLKGLLSWRLLSMVQDVFRDKVILMVALTLAPWFFVGFLLHSGDYVFPELSSPMSAMGRIAMGLDLLYVSLVFASPLWFGAALLAAIFTRTVSVGRNAGGLLIAFFLGQSVESLSWTGFFLLKDSWWPYVAHELVVRVLELGALIAIAIALHHLDPPRWRALPASHAERFFGATRRCAVTIRGMLPWPSPAHSETRRP